MRMGSGVLVEFLWADLETRVRSGRGRADAARRARVILLLAEGCSYQTAGGELGVSINTVRNYIRNVYEKLQVHTKSAAVSKAMRAGLL